MYYARMLDARATLNATWKPRRQVETTCSCECRCMFHILWEFDVLEEDGGSHPHEISFKDLFGCVVFFVMDSDLEAGGDDADPRSLVQDQ